MVGRLRILGSGLVTALWLGLVSAAPVSAHGGDFFQQLMGMSTCQQNSGDNFIHLTVFGRSGLEPYCDGLPTGPLTMVFAAAGPQVANKPVSFELDQGSRPILSLPSQVYPGGVLTIVWDFKQADRYQALINYAEGPRFRFVFYTGGLLTPAALPAWLGRPITWVVVPAVTVVGAILGPRYVRSMRRRRQRRKLRAVA